MEDTGWGDRQRYPFLVSSTDLSEVGGRVRMPEIQVRLLVLPVFFFPASSVDRSIFEYR